MDPTQTANPQDNQQGWGFVPFGGNPPQPPVPVPPISVPLSMTDPLDAQWGMPPFHFDESEFAMPPITPSAWIGETSVPFGGIPASIPAPVVVTPPVLEEQIATPALSIEMPPMDMPSPFAPRPDLEDDKPAQTTVETQTGNEPFATTWFDLPSFDTTPTIDTTSTDAWPFAMPTPESEVITTNESDDTLLPSFELPSIETNTPAPVSTDADTSFDLPSFDTTPTIATSPGIVEQAPEITMPSFDMPSTETSEIATPEMPSFDLPTPEAPTTPVSPVVEMSTIETPVMEMPVIESPVIEASTPVTTDTPPMPTPAMPIADDESDDENNDDGDSDDNDTAATMDMPSSSTTTLSNNENNIATSEEQFSPVKEEDPQSSVFVSNATESEIRNPQSAIDTAYTTFVDTLTRLLDLTKTETISIVGHHTDDEHISYEFSHDETESVVIKHHDLTAVRQASTADKSSDTQTLSIDHSDGLSVYLNDELLADYSDTSVVIDEQISYYINDKLSKFTLMIESEYEKLNKKTKEAEEKKKKLLADLRAF